jgi:hypothetical protein
VSEAAGDTQTAGTAVSGGTTGEQDRASTEMVAHVRVADGPLVGPTLRRMVSIVLARADWPLDGLDDALLVCDALSAHAPARARAGYVALGVKANEREAELRVGELSGEGAAGLLKDAMLPVVGNVLEGIADSVSTEPEEGGGSQLVLILRPS